MTIKIKKLMEYLIYLMVVLYFVGKLYEPISIIIDILFIIYICKNQDRIKFFKGKYYNLIVSLILLFLYYFLQSLFMANNTIDALRGSVGTIRFAILIFAAIEVFDSKDKVKKLLLFSYIGVGIVMIDSFYQFFIGKDIFGYQSYQNGARLTAWYKLPKVNMELGEFFGIFIVAPLIFKKDKKIFSIIFIIMVSILFVLSGNRSPIFAMVTAIMFLLIFVKYRKYIILTLIVMSLTFIYTLSNKNMQNSMKVLLKPNSSQATSGRIPIYLTALKIIEKNYLVGIGVKNFNKQFKKYYSKVDFKNRYKKYRVKAYEKEYAKTAPSHVHSVFLDMIISCGIIGFFFILNFFYNVYKYFIKNNLYGLLTSIGLLYCITPLQFARSFYQSNWQFITYLSIIFIVAVSNNYAQENSIKYNMGIDK